MAKESVLFINSNCKPVLERLQSLYTVYNYRDARDRAALVAEAAKTTRAVFANEGSWVPSRMDALPRLELIVLVLCMSRRGLPDGVLRTRHCIKSRRKFKYR